MNAGGHTLLGQWTTKDSIKDIYCLSGCEFGPSEEV